MKYKISYYTSDGDSMFSLPTFTHEEFVESDTLEILEKYIETKKDGYGGKFTKKESYGFTHISNSGALKVEEYVKPIKPKFKKLTP